jgi:outer membrane protein assembly factor BamD (BamD/ComL family)
MNVKFVSFTFGAFCFFTFGFLISCQTIPKDIPTDLTPSELVQKAQDAADKNNYKSAETYYDVILERYPLNNEFVCISQYEIAHLHYKQRKWDLAKSELLALLDRYTKADAELLPAKYKTLSNIVLEEIREKQAGSKKSHP